MEFNQLNGFFRFLVVVKFLEPVIWIQTIQMGHSYNNSNSSSSNGNRQWKKIHLSKAKKKISIFQTWILLIKMNYFSFSKFHKFFFLYKIHRHELCVCVLIHIVEFDMSMQQKKYCCLSQTAKHCTIQQRKKKFIFDDRFVSQNLKKKTEFTYSMNGACLCVCVCKCVAWLNGYKVFFSLFLSKIQKKKKSKF